MAKEYWCPWCLRCFPLPDEVAAFRSGVAIAGPGIAWSGNLEKEIHKVKRVAYCRACNRPFDRHALFRGRLDFWGTSILAAYACVVLAIVSTIAGWHSFWTSLIAGSVAAVVLYVVFDRLEKALVRRWRFTPEQADKLRQAS